MNESDLRAQGYIETPAGWVKRKAGGKQIKPESVKLEPITDVAKLNKTETSYFKFLKSGGLCAVWIGVQCVTLKLADDCRLTPDFAVLNHKDELSLIDVKGFQREDALIKMKVAARMFPFIKFIIVKRDGVGWTHEDVKP